MSGKMQAVLPPEETALFCEQLAMALSAGIPLLDAMETLKDTYKSSRYGNTFVAMFETVERTGSLQKAMAGVEIFPVYAVGMAGVGERTGKLDSVLTALGAYYRWEADVRISVHNAVVYPIVLVVMLSVVVVLLLTSVLPVFERVFENLGVSADTGVMSASFVIGKVALAFIGVVLLVGLITAMLLRGRHRQRVFDWLCRILPALGHADEKLAAGRLSNILATMLSAGCRLDAALTLAPQVIGNARYLKKVDACMRALQEGSPFALAAENAELFDNMHVRMVRFGEQTGRLDTVMEKVRALYQQEADSAIDVIVASIEPALVTVLSLVIGSVLLTVMLPLLTVISAIG